MTRKAAGDELHIAVETFFANVNGEALLIRRGTPWRGEVVRLHPDYFCPASDLTYDHADENERELARRRAALQTW
jgi:hypothetical protein